MNVVVANEFKDGLKSLGVEISGILEGEYAAEVIIETFSNYYYEKLIFDVTSINGYTNTASLIVNLKKIFTFLDPTRTILLLKNSSIFNNSTFLSKLVALNIYNFTFDINEVIPLLANPKTYEQVVEYANFNETIQSRVLNTKTRVIGVKNVTEQAGATTLIYMMYQELLKNYKVKCIEIDRNDFKYFYNEDLKSIKNEQLMDEFLHDEGLDVILIDLNGYENDMLIKETLYLIEPSVIKLNKLIAHDKDVFNKLLNERINVSKRIILNRTDISLDSVRQFEEETGLKTFDIIRNVNERSVANSQVMNLLIKLGFNKTNGGVIIPDNTEKKKTLLDSFR